MIVYKSEAEIEAMRKSNRIVAEILADLKKMIRPGVTTIELAEFAERESRERGAIPAFKGYRGYPASLCTSVNEEIVHGIPSSRRLREGDIISLDFGILYKGYYGDAAVTYQVGEVSPRVKALIETAVGAFYAGMEEIREGNRISNISHAVQKHVESRGFSVIRSFVGHGIGHSLHEEPQVPNFGLPGRGPKMKRGLTLAIEPMIAMEDWQVEILKDGWTAVTKDRGLSAHFEHTVALTGNGVEILSLADEQTGEEVFEVKESRYA